MWMRLSSPQQIAIINNPGLIQDAIINEPVTAPRPKDDITMPNNSLDPASIRKAMSGTHDLEIVGCNEDHSHRYYGKAEDRVLPNVGQAFADLAGLLVRRSAHMKTADIEDQQNEDDEAETDGIDEKARGRAEARNQEPAGHGADHPPR